MMTRDEITVAAKALRDQFATGAPLGGMLERMQWLQPNYKEFWLQTALSVESGRPLSESMLEVWPETLVRVLEAGEYSGKMRGVLDGIVKNIEVHKQTAAVIRKLLYPILTAAGGVVGFLVYMVFVIAPLAKSMSSKMNHNAVMEFALWFSDFVHENWLVLSVGVVVGTAWLVTWVLSDEGKETIIELGFSLPGIREHLCSLYFGMWAGYASLVTAAGIPTIQALQITVEVLPRVLRESIDVFRYDMEVNNRSMGDAASLDKQGAGDPRVVWWPYYLTNAFVVAEQTGRVDAQLSDAAPILVENGQKGIGLMIDVFYYTAMVFGTVMILLPYGAFYSEVFSIMRTMGR